MHEWTARISAGLAGTMKNASAGDVLELALQQHVEIVSTISKAGFGDRPLRGAHLLGLYVQSCNVLASRAARKTKEIQP